MIHLKRLLYLFVLSLVLVTTPILVTANGANVFLASAGATCVASAEDAGSPCEEAIDGDYTIDNFWQTGDADQVPISMYVDTGVAGGVEGDRWSILPHTAGGFEPTDFTLHSSTDASTDCNSGTWDLRDTIVDNPDSSINFTGNFIFDGLAQYWCWNTTKWNNGSSSGGGMATVEVVLWNATADTRPEFVTVTAIDTSDSSSILSFNISLDNSTNVIRNGTNTGDARLKTISASYNLNITDPSGRYTNDSTTYVGGGIGVIQFNLTPVRSLISVYALNRTETTILSTYDVNITGFEVANNHTSSSVAYLYVTTNQLYNLSINHSSLGFAVFGFNASLGSLSFNVSLPNFTLISTPVWQIETSEASFSLGTTLIEDDQYSNLALIFNGTSYEASRVEVGSNVHYNTTILMPVIDGIGTNFNYYWNYTLLAATQNTETFSLTISDFLLSNCDAGANPANVTLNFSIWDEDTPTIHRTAGFKADFNIYSVNSSTSLNVSFDLSGADSYAFCISPSNATVKADALIKYDVDGGFTHSYILNKFDISNTTSFIDLYNYNTTVGISDFRGTIRDTQSFQFFPNIITQLQRRYVGEGLWRTVQMDKSGDFGLIFFNIKEETTEYRFIFYDTNNIVLKTTASMKFSCDSGICELTFLVDPAGETSDAADLGVFTSYNNNTQILTVSWVDATGDTDTVTVRVTKDTFSSSIDVCNQQFTGSSGSTTCDTSAYTGPFRLQVYREASPEQFAFAETFGGQARALRDFLGGGADSSLYSGLILVTIGILGVTVGPIGAVLSVVSGLIALALLGINTFITPALIIVVGIVSGIIGVKLKGRRNE